MLHEPDRHESLRVIAWDEARVRDAIARIVRDTEARFSPASYWPLHPHDVECDEDLQRVATPFYFGASGVIWALHHLQSVGAVQLQRSYLGELESLLSRNRDWLRSVGSEDFASYLMGDTPILLMAHGHAPSAALADRLAALIEANQDHPSRELMWGAPGTLLASLFLFERSGEARWADLFRATAARLWSRLEWSAEHGCHFWTQTLSGRSHTFLDAVHGFVATASPLIRGRSLLDADSWAAWERCIVNTVSRTASVEGGLANWRPELTRADDKPQKRLMQFCHGAPGFVICLAELANAELDPLLLAGGEAIWAAGPLAKGSNLCHGTGGNGYAFLKLHARTGDPVWLERARAFAMHSIEQTDADAQRYGQMRYSLWTGDPGFAIYLWDCLQQQQQQGARFPTLDVFYGD